MDHMITVQLADKTGHTQMTLSPADTVETIQQNSGAWVYADNQLIQADQVNEDNLSTVSSVRILPGLVGGWATNCNSQPRTRPSPAGDG